MKLAIVHDWLTGFGGAERCLIEFANLWPDAPIYTSVYDVKRFKDIIPPRRVRTSFLQNFPNSTMNYRSLLPLMPMAFRSFDLKGFDVILSSSHCCAKGIRRPKSAVHISFIYTPMRYVWELYTIYRDSMSGVKRFMFESMAPSLRKWDIATSRSVDYFIPISREVDRRIQSIYGRKGAAVIYPPVDVKKLLYDGPKGDHFLIAHRFVPYKRVDIAIKAFTDIGLPLKVLGIGPDEQKLRRIAGKNIEFIGFVPDDKLAEIYGSSRALIFTSYEDFGLTPIESMAAGTPVIAYGRGGALETVIDGRTGIFFRDQTSASVIDAVKRFEKFSFSRDDLINRAWEFDVSIFRKQIKEFVENAAPGSAGVPPADARI